MNGAAFLFAAMTAAGCTLDLDRLRGSRGDAGPPIDAPLDVPGLDAATDDGGMHDGGEDAGPFDAGPPREIVLAVLGTTALSSSTYDSIGMGVTPGGAAMFAVGSRNDNNVSVYVVDRTACAYSPTIFSTYVGTGPPLVVDLDRNGALDVFHGTTSTALGVIFGLSPGVLGTQTTIELGIGPVSALAANDLDDDGGIDLVVSELGPRLTTVAHDGTGALTPPVSSFMHLSSATHVDLAMADLVGNDAYDIATVAVSTGLPGFVGFPAVGGGDFATGFAAPATGDAPRRIAAGILEGVRASAVAVGGSTMYTALVSGSAWQIEAHVLSGSDLVDVAVAELDGDPGGEIVLLDASGARRIVVVELDTGALVQRATFELTDFPKALAIADLDDDGFDELAVLSGDDVDIVGLECSP